MVGAITLAVLAIITFGGRNFLEEQDEIVMYFSGSVNGLNTGAPVNVRGVQIGTVKQINIIFNTDTGEFRVPVIAELNPGSIARAQQLKVGEMEGDPIQILIEKLGLRAQLQLQSILTSQLYIELDYHPETRISYHGDGSMLEIPTIPMPIDQLDKVLDKISLEEVVENFTSSLSALKRILNSPEIPETISAIHTSFTQIENVSKELDIKLDDISTRMQRVMTEVESLALEMQQAFKSANRILADDSPEIIKFNDALVEISDAAVEIREAARKLNTFQDSPEVYRINQALEEITRASRSVRDLADMLEQHPEAILTGRKEEN